MCRKSLTWLLGITPFVDPEDLKFFFQEIHRVTGAATWQLTKLWWLCMADYDTWIDCIYRFVLYGLCSLSNVLIPNIICLIRMGFLQYQETRDRSKPNLPHVRLLLHKSLHQIHTLLVLQHHHLDTSLFQIRLPSQKTLILPNNHTPHLVQDTCTSAHVTRRKRRIHRSTLISGRRESPRVLQCRYLRLKKPIVN